MTIGNSFMKVNENYKLVKWQTIFNLWSWKMISVLETSQAIKQWAIKLDLLTIGNNQEEAIEIRLFFG